MSKSNFIGIVGIILAVAGIIVSIFMTSNNTHNSAVNNQTSQGDKSPTISTNGNVTINYDGNSTVSSNMKKYNSMFHFELENQDPRCIINKKVAKGIIIGESFYQKNDYKRCIDNMSNTFSDTKDPCENAAVALVIGACHYKYNNVFMSIRYFNMAKNYYEAIAYTEKEYELAIKMLTNAKNSVNNEDIKEAQRKRIEKEEKEKFNKLFNSWKEINNY